MIAEAEGIYQQAVGMEERAAEIDTLGTSGAELDAQRTFAALRRDLSAHRSALAILVVRIETRGKEKPSCECKLSAIAMIAAALERDDITPQLLSDLVTQFERTETDGNQR